MWLRRFSLGPLAALCLLGPHEPRAVPGLEYTIHVVRHAQIAGDDYRDEWTSVVQSTSTRARIGGHNQLLQLIDSTGHVDWADSLYCLSNYEDGPESELVFTADQFTIAADSLGTELVQGSQTQHYRLRVAYGFSSRSHGTGPNGHA